MNDELSEQQVAFQMNCLKQTVSERKFKERIQTIYALGYHNALKHIEPTLCSGCSFKCQASDCDCQCHDIIRDFYKRLENEK